MDDARAFVENENAYRKKFEQSGTLSRLYQTYTTAGGHCLSSTRRKRLRCTMLVSWINTGTAPTDQQTTAACEKYRSRLGGTCRFNFISAGSTGNESVRALRHRGSVMLTSAHEQQQESKHRNSIQTQSTQRFAEDSQSFFVVTD
jgi:hypothetical protein